MVLTHLPDALHRAADLVRRPLEAVEVPSRDLRHDVVEARLEAGRRRQRRRVADRRQRDAERELRGDERQRVAVTRPLIGLCASG